MPAPAPKPYPLLSPVQSLRPADAVKNVEREFKQACAEALYRISSRLQAYLSDLARIESRLALADRRERPKLIEEYNVAYEQARTYRWYLEVQREAMGQRRHDIVDEFYPLPRRLRLSAEP